LAGASWILTQTSVWPVTVDGQVAKERGRGAAELNYGGSI
jgi:hypothetical protein